MKPEFALRCRGLALAVVLAFLLPACAAMPTGGEVREGRPGGDDQERGEPVVQVFAEPPGGGESALQIVQGFLEAAAAGEADYATARAYLAPPADKEWRPHAGISVYDHEAVAIRDVPGGRVELAAPLVGTADFRGAFTPAAPDEQVAVTFGLALVEEEWRIVDAPPGLYLSWQDFRREYRPVVIQFLTPDGSALVPDVVHLPSRRPLASPVTTQLLTGPTAWLSGAVGTAVPRGTALAGPVTVRGGVAEVRLTAPPLALRAEQQERLVAQLVWTLTQLPDIRSVQVRADGRPLGAIGQAPRTRNDSRRFAPTEQKVEAVGYFVRDGRAVRIDGRKVPGVLANGRLAVAEVNASGRRQTLAGISADRGRLLAGSPERPTVRLSEPALHSPSYTQPGDLWVVSGDGPAPQVWQVPVTGPVHRVALSGLGARAIRTLRVSDDGTRVALVVAAPGGEQLLVGSVFRQSGQVVVSGLRPVGYGLLHPRDAAWVAGDRLVVVAERARSQPQPYTVIVDGSDVIPGEPLADIETVAAAPRQPLVAGTSDGRVWRLPEGGTWVLVGPGRRPVYSS